MTMMANQLLKYIPELMVPIRISLIEGCC